MIVLTQTTDVIQVLLGGAVTTSQLNCVANYRDITTSLYTPGRTVVNTNNTTAVNLVPSPGASTQRVVDFLSVFNSDTVNAQVTVRFSDNGTFYTLFRAVLAPNEKLEYIDGQGFRTINTAGSIKTALNQSTAPAYGVIDGSVGGLSLATIADPSAPGSDLLTFYAKKICGRNMPKWIGPAGIDTAVQPWIATNKIGYWNPPGNANTAPAVFGYTAHTAVGTATARNVTSVNLFQRMRRLGYVSAASVGSLASARSAVAQFALGNGDGYAGFFKLIRFGCSDAATVAGARMFVGMAASTTAPTNVEPSALTNVIGVGHGALDTNYKLFYGGSTAQTPIDLGASFPCNTLSTDVYELALFSPPNQEGIVHWRVQRLNAGGYTAEGTLGPSNGINLPSTATLLTNMWAYRTNNSTALAVGMDIMSDYIETDY